MVAAFWLRGALKASRQISSRFYCQLPKNAGTSKLGKKQNLPLFRKPQARGCVHSGATNIARKERPKDWKNDIYFHEIFLEICEKV